MEPPFREYFFSDLDEQNVKALKYLAGDRHDVHVLHGDANVVLPTTVLPQVKYEDYRRGLCFLDPYGLDLNWQVVEAIGRMRSIEIFLNFPLMDMNRNILWANPDTVTEAQRQRMNAFWGDESWRQVAYTTTGSLFGWETKEPSWVLAKSYQKRLRQVAGFRYVPDPVPMYISTGAIVYYLFFASHQPVAAKIVTDIFAAHRQRRP